MAKNTPHQSTGVLSSNPFIEKLTRTHIAIPLIIFNLLSGVLAGYGISEGLITGALTTILVIAGILTFTLIEYIMHRFFFHFDPSTPRQEKLAYNVHGVHHEYPKDRDRLAMPIPASLTLSLLFYLFFKFIMGNLVYGFLPGFLIGYTLYLGIHYMVHAFKAPKNFFKILWIHHGIHHYKDDKNAFGVSSPLWDWVFNTLPKK